MWGFMSVLYNNFLKVLPNMMFLQAGIDENTHSTLVLSADRTTKQLGCLEDKRVNKVFNRAIEKFEVLSSLC